MPRLSRYETLLSAVWLDPWGSDEYYSAMIGRYLRLVGAIVAVSATVACSSDTPTASQPVSLPSFDGIFDFTDTATVDGRLRSWIVHLPTTYDHEARLPLLLAFHGAGESAQGMQAGTGLDGTANERGFVAVYPRATSLWAEGCDCTSAEAQGVDDVEFVRFLIGRLAQTYAIDAERVYAAGFSQGGAFTERLACELDRPVAGIAVVGMTMRRGLLDVCAVPIALGLSIPALLMHGTEDNTVPAEGSGDEPGSVLSLAEAADVLLRLNRCSGAPAVTFEPAGPEILPRFRREVYSDCANDGRVEIDIVEGVATNGLHRSGIQPVLKRAG
ncbi:MAG: PHB depolymerase family esterase [Gemmatimonadota bacterium]